MQVFLPVFVQNVYCFHQFHRNILQEIIEAIAISYDNQNGMSDRPVSPCGICRQTLLEYEERQQQPIRLILGGMEGEVYVIPKASLLMPLSFGSKNMTAM